MSKSKLSCLQPGVVIAVVALLSGCGGSSSDNSAANTVDPATPNEQSGGGTDGADGENTSGGGTSTEVRDVMAMAAPLSPVMRSGFEPGTIGAPAEAILTFSGVDNSMDLPNDWANLSAANLARPGGYFEIQYQGGDTTQRYAVLSPDPADASNQTLEFWLQDENVEMGDPATDWYELRGRVQANFYENYNLDTYYQSVRVRFGRDFQNLIEHNGTFDWLTIFEAWNGALWLQDEDYPFHLAVNLVKPNGPAGTRLHFKAHGQTFVEGTGFVDSWSDTNEDFAVPLERWMTLELYMRQGDADTGRFYMTVQADGGDKVVLFDQVNFTHHPDDPAPGGFDFINPIKLYTLEPVLDIVNATGGVMQVHWDDLEFGHTAN